MSSDPQQQTKPKKIIGYTVPIILAAVFVVLYLIVNFDPIKNFFGGILSKLSPIIIGAAIAYALNPILKLFEYHVFHKIKKNGPRRALSMVCTAILSVILVGGFVWLLLPSVFQSLSDLFKNFNGYLTSTAKFINTTISKFTDSSHTEQYLDADEISRAIQNFLFKSGDIFETVLTYVTTYGMSLFNGVKNFLLAVVLSIYMLCAKEKLYAIYRKFVTAVFREKSASAVLRYCTMTNKMVGQFFLGKILDSAIIAVITFFLLLIFGIPYPLLVAFIIGLTNIIPVFGPFIGAIPSFFIIFITNPIKAFIFLILIILIQQFDGNVLGPKILGDRTGLSALGVILAITIMSAYFGLLGMIIGVPVFGMIVVIIRELMNTSLRKKKKPTDLAEYYDKNMQKPEERHKNFIGKIYRKMDDFFMKHVWNPLFHRKQKQKGYDITSDTRYDGETEEIPGVTEPTEEIPEGMFEEEKESEPDPIPESSEAGSSENEEESEKKENG